MSKLQARLSVLWKGLKNADKVIEAMITQIKMEDGSLSEDKVEEILRRRLICSECPFMSENAKTSQEYLDIFGKNYIPELSYKHCSLCECTIDRKTACLSCNCGIQNYNDEHKDKQLNLKPKWTTYESNSTTNPTDNVINDNIG